MLRQLSLSKTCCWGIFLTLVTTPVLAHKVELAGDVAGTWHVEPNHNPKAGESSLIWVALTRKGGKILPLSDANCQMSVYSLPRKATDTAILQPSLKAINAENYQGIPGAEIIFPKIGIYQFELSCKPKQANDFQPFQMKYDVTVAASSAKTPQPEPVLNKKISTTTQTKEQQQSNIPLLVISGFLGLGIMGVVVRRFK